MPGLLRGCGPFRPAFVILDPWSSPSIPDELSAALAASGQDLPRTVLEAIALEAYRERKLTIDQLRRLLGFESRHELDGFLKQHEVWHADTGEATTLIQENGLLVHLGKAPQSFDWDHMVDEQREERIREISGL